MSIFVEPQTILSHIFQACSTDQIKEFIPEKRGFRIHGHSTTIRLEAAYWVCCRRDGSGREYERESISGSNP